MHGGSWHLAAPAATIGNGRQPSGRRTLKLWMNGEAMLVILGEPRGQDGSVEDATAPPSRGAPAPPKDVTAEGVGAPPHDAGSERRSDFPPAVDVEQAPGADLELEHVPRSETAEKRVRETPDRLSDEVVAELARGATGATEAAFFDLDKTVLARSSTLAFGREMHRGGLLTTTSLLKGLYAQMIYTRTGADHERMERLRTTLLQMTTGWDAERVQEILREALEDVIVPLVYQEALELFEEHRSNSRDLWLVSSSGEEIVRPIAEYLGVPNVIASRAHVDGSGCFDGTLEFYAYGPHKATGLRQVASARGYDLTRCYSYSDSVTDLPMLSAVGHPVAINPDRELRAAAKAMGWPIRDFNSPVTLRSRLPNPPSPSTMLVGLTMVAAAGAAAWWWSGRGPAPMRRREAGRIYV
ncbi:MAG: HAD-IB family hydrolase [Actinomycetota bacterium]|nr:HAD-IB family hydrolase [Actinomycetota bacterium]